MQICGAILQTMSSRGSAAPIAPVRRSTGRNLDMPRQDDLRSGAPEHPAGSLKKGRAATGPLKLGA
jgi:hypothetical protein